MNLAEQILQYRAKHRLSQSKMAELCGVSTMTINAVERGIQTPSAVTEAKIRLILEGTDEDEHFED